MTVRRNLVTRLFKFIMAASICVATPVLSADENILPASSDEIKLYRNIGSWSVHENLTRKSCFISQADDKGYLVQMGMAKGNEFGYVGIFKKDAEIPEGDKAVAILVNDHIYSGKTHNVTDGISGNYVGGYILADTLDLQYDLKNSEAMVIFPDMDFNVTVSLQDARNAIFEAQQCTEKLHNS